MVNSVTNMVNTITELSKKSNWANMSYSNPKVNNAILSLYCLGQASKKQLSGKPLETFPDWNLSEDEAIKYEELEEISASYSNPKVNNAILSLYCLGQASNKQLSGKLLDTFHDWNLSEDEATKYEELEEISAYLQVIEGLGWLEHTGDWDPSLVIGTNNGDTISLENGYWQFHLLDDEDGEIYLVSSNMDEGGQEYEVKVNIREIESINILEY